MNVSDNDASLRAGNNIGLRIFFCIAAVLAIPALVLGPVRSFGANEDGVALAIIYDTSGSMKDFVPDTAGKSAQKYVIANRALISIARQVQAFATRKESGQQRRIDAGLFVFEGSGAREAIPFGPFNEQAFVNFAKGFSAPNGNTPLGNALNAAGHAVLNSSLSHKHVLIITDGMNTAGPPPASILSKLKQEATEKQSAVSVHFVAFDVDAKVFEPLKQRGATVVGAANETQLNSQLQFILQRKILLEEEETPTRKP